jgi:hypothetical protein
MPRRVDPGPQLGQDQPWGGVWTKRTGKPQERAVNYEKGRNDFRILAGAACGAAVLGLAACGGGGGGGGDSTSTTSDPTSSDQLTSTVAIDDSNANETVKSTIGGSASAVSTTASAESTGSTYGVATVAGGEGLVPTTLAAARDAQEEAVGGNLIGGATSIDCTTSGTFSFSTSPANDSDPLDTVGDSMTFTYDNCDFGSGQVFDGSFSLTLKGGTFSDSSTSYDLLIEYTEYKVEGTLYSDGTLRIKSGTETGTWPDGHGLSGKVPAGDEVEAEVRLGDDGSDLSIKDLAEGETFRYEKLAMFLRDGTLGDNEFTATTPFYLAYHGTGATGNTNTGKICADALGGCVTVSHSGTSAFEFTGSDYPTDGVYEVLGDGSSKLTLDADTGDPATAHLTVVDQGGNTVVDEKRNWSDLSDESFADSLN